MKLLYSSVKYGLILNGPVMLERLATAALNHSTYAAYLAHLGSTGLQNGNLNRHSPLFNALVKLLPRVEGRSSLYIFIHKSLKHNYANVSVAFTN